MPPRQAVRQPDCEHSVGTMPSHLLLALHDDPSNQALYHVRIASPRPPSGESPGKREPLRTTGGTGRDPPSGSVQPPGPMLRDHLRRHALRARGSASRRHGRRRPADRGRRDQTALTTLAGHDTDEAQTLAVPGPTVGGSPLHTLSKRAPSTTRTSLRAAAPRGSRIRVYHPRAPGWWRAGRCARLNACAPEAGRTAARTLCNLSLRTASGPEGSSAK